MKKDTHTLLPLLLSVVSFVFIAAGIMSVFLFQNQLREGDFDTRNQASVSNGQVTVTASPASGTFTVGQSTTINLQVDTNALQVDGIQLVFNVVTSADTLNLTVPSGSGLIAAHREVEQVADGFLVSLIVLPQNITQSFSSTDPVTFATLTFTPTEPGTTSLTFDQENSLSTVHASNPPRDELNRLTTVTYTVSAAAGQASPSPSPSPSVSPTPTATPVTVAQCNASCTSSAQCPVNFRCYENRCRLAINVTSTTCANPGDQGLQRQCNEYCADTRECASGFTCFNNRCRRPDNPDSASCAVTATSTAQAMAQSCNAQCASNKDCAVNLRCYENRCRLATNTSSLSCSAPTKSTVSQLYSSKGAEIPVPSGLAVSASSTPRPSASPLIMEGADKSGIGADDDRTTSFSPLSSMMENLRSLAGRLNLSFPFLAVIGGIVLLILALILLLGGGNRNRQSPPKVVPSPIAPNSYEQTLQKKIDSLKAAQKPSSPLQPTQQDSMIQKMREKKLGDVEVAPTSPAPTVVSTPVPAATPVAEKSVEPSTSTPPATPSTPPTMPTA